MADLEAREAKLIQYLNEAYGKEKELETALQAHIAMTTRDAYKKRLKDHLKETKAQAKGLERRIKQLGGKADALPAPGPDVVQEAAGAVVSAANKAVAAAKGPMHALRGTGEQEKMLKNAKTEYFNEAEEIANYNAIETLAEAVGDKDTAKLAKEYRRQEERMSKFLDKTIVALTKEVVKEEIPASQRKSSRSGPSRSRASSKAGKSSRSRSSASRASTARSSSSRASSNSASGKSKAKSGSSRSRSTAKK
jgi:ferritin-like metal-binding protein YciE